MDNRWKFLYCIKTEPWGHRKEVIARDGKTGESEIGVNEEKPINNLKS